MNAFDDIDEHVVIQSRIISLNSRFATTKINGSKHSSVLFDFNSIAPKDPQTLYHTIAIQSAEIPASYYNIHTQNNTINITDSVGTTATVTIAIGNYDANTFAAEFITKFNAAAFANDATLTFNTLVGRYSLMSDTASVNLTVNLAATTCREPLGISLDDNGSLVFNYAADNPSFMPLPANFLGVTKIKILSDALAGGNFESNRLTTTTLVDTISASAFGFGLTLFNSLGRETFVKAKRIDEIDLQILNQNNELIDFNGINWTLTLLINTHRRQQFSRTDATLLVDTLKRQEKAIKKTASTKEELEDVIFNDPPL